MSGFVYLNGSGRLPSRRTERTDVITLPSPQPPSVHKGLVLLILVNEVIFKFRFDDFSGGPVVKNLPANTGDMGLSPGPGRFHMPWGQLSWCTTELNLCTPEPELCTRRAATSSPPCNEKHAHN